MLYKEDEPFLDRLKIYKNYVLPALKNQDRLDFDIAVLCNKKHSSYIEGLGLIPFYSDTFGDTTGKYYRHRIPYEKTYGLGKYDIQTSIDSDDVPGRKYVSLMRDVIDEEVSAGFTGKLHVHYQPEKMRVDTGEVSGFNKTYTKNFGSAFYSIYQDNEPYIGVGHTGHSKMGRLCDKSIKLPTGHCWALIHNKNHSTSWNS